MAARKALHPFVVIKGSSHVITTLEEQKPLISDAQSEAVGHDSAFSTTIHRSQGKCCNKTSSLARPKAKGKAHSKYYDEPLLKSSSLGDSDNKSLKRKHDETTCSSDNDEEPEYAVKENLARKKGSKVKRSRNASEIHSLQERRRRDTINKKMRILKGLIPNCNKMDKASLLDHAIEYVKTLKLQLQIMSMGGGICMPLMMLSAAATHQMINTPHLPQFMGAGMGFRPQFPIAPLPGVTDNGVGMFGFPNQVPHMPNSHAPFVPMAGNPHIQPPVATSEATKLAENFCTVNHSNEYATKQALNQIFTVGGLGA